MTPKEEHDQYTSLIYFNPSVLGLDDIMLATGESSIFRKGLVYSQPDNLLFDPSTQTLYHVEYKTHNRTKTAKEQINKRHNPLKEIFSVPYINIVGLYVTDNFKVQRVR